MRFASLVATGTAALALMFGLTGCPSHPAVKDTDMTPSMEDPRVPPDLEVEDAIDAKKDKIDYKILQPTDAGKAEVDVDFGTGHLVEGSIGVYGSDGTSLVEEKPVTKDDAKYSIKWDVAEDAVYYLKVAATAGKGGYKVDFKVTKPAPKDPCADMKCEEDQECKAEGGVGKCIDVKPPECDPKCKAGTMCINGTCEKPCGGNCKKGELCNAKKNECYKDPCYQKQCAANEKCVGGTCKPKDVPPPVTDKVCTPACTGTAKCNGKTGQCEGGDVTPPPVDDCAGPLSGAIVQVLPQGTKTVLVINRGSKVCVKVGQTGKIAGVAGAFKVTEVYEFRCKAIIEVDDKTIGSNRGVTINR